MLTAEYRHSPLLKDAGFRHAFFTRNGGFSVGPYRALNFSFAVGDDSEHVDGNLALAAQALQVDAGRLFFPAQVHGAGVMELAGDEAQLDVVMSEVDALVSGHADIACAVRTADCVPILLADPTTGRVAAIHAGWRGLEAGVVHSAARQLGGSPDRWLAAIGPHISVSAFEVSQDVAERLAACSSADTPIVQEPNQKPHVDLLAITRAQLEREGVAAHNIDVVEGCTKSQPESFYSYRRDGKLGGRHLSAIVPLG